MVYLSSDKILTQLLDKLLARARDRPYPYKKGKTLTGALRILRLMCVLNHIDPDLFNLFIDQRLYQRYADQYMELDQIDEVDHSSIPGHQA